MIIIMVHFNIGMTYCIQDVLFRIVWNRSIRIFVFQEEFFIRSLDIDLARDLFLDQVPVYNHHQIKVKKKFNKIKKPKLAYF